MSNHVAVWQNPSVDVPIRHEAALRIQNIIEKGMGERTRDKRREYRVTLALERLCYEHAKSREEFTDSSKLNLLVHRMAAEKAKRRRGKDGAGPMSKYQLHDMLSGGDPEVAERNAAMKNARAAQQQLMRGDPFMGYGGVIPMSHAGYPVMVKPSDTQGKAMYFQNPGDEFVQPVMKMGHGQFVDMDNPRPKQRARTSPQLPMYSGGDFHGIGGLVPIPTIQPYVGFHPSSHEQQQFMHLQNQQQQQFMQQRQQFYIQQQQQQQQQRQAPFQPPLAGFDELSMGVMRSRGNPVAGRHRQRASTTRSELPVYMDPNGVEMVPQPPIHGSWQT